MLCNCCRQLKAQEVAKKGGQKQMGGADVQSKAPTTTQSKANDPKVPHAPAVLAVGRAMGSPVQKGTRAMTLGELTWA